jgi:hypothetical protein
VTIRAFPSLRSQARPGAAGVSEVRNRYGDPLLLLMMTTTGLVLLLACTNLANPIGGASRAAEPIPASNV